MQLTIQHEIRIPKGPSYGSGGWEKYVRRGYSGAFCFALPGMLLLPVGVRLPVYLQRGTKPVATAMVTSVDFRVDKVLGKEDASKEVETTIMFDATQPA